MSADADLLIRIGFERGDAGLLVAEGCKVIVCFDNPGYADIELPNGHAVRWRLNFKAAKLGGAPAARVH